MDVHKNAPLTPKGREAMVRGVMEGGLSKAAGRLCIHRRIALQKRSRKRRCPCRCSETGKRGFTLHNKKPPEGTRPLVRGLVVVGSDSLGSFNETKSNPEPTRHVF